MLAIGNSISNSVYEANVCGFSKPNTNSTREEKETWIRRKYETKEFVTDIDNSLSSEKLLIEAVVRYLRYRVLIFRALCKKFNF